MVRGYARPESIWRSAGMAALCAGLSSCAHAPNWMPWHRTPPAAQSQAAAPARSPKETRRPTRHSEHRARPTEHPAQVAMIEPANLVGKKRSDVTRLLGAPDRISKDDPSLVWTYEADGCALRIYFYPDLKTSAFHVLKFSLAGADGKPLDADAPCRRKLLAMRENDTG